jgi:hypothetical protein
MCSCWDHVKPIWCGMWMCGVGLGLFGVVPSFVMQLTISFPIIPM